jgi:HEAT repeats
VTVARRMFQSIESAAVAAEQALANGRLKDAERAYRELLGQTHVVDYEYDDWLRALAEVYRQLGRGGDAGHLYLYLHYFDLARGCFADAPALRGRLAEIEKRWPDAAAAYEQAGLAVHGAVAWEKAKRPEQARTAWAALVGHPGLRDRPYEQALVHFNLGVATGHDPTAAAAAQRELVEAQRRLEQVADDFETKGELERAFDCYQILLKLGKDSGQFENLAEGYVNCIRVLRDDNLKFYVLQYYEDFIRLALGRRELHAAATLYQEAAAYAQKTGLPYDRRYQSKSGETWVLCAEHYADTGMPIEMVENALLAAAQQFSATGDHAQVRKVFEKLATLDLSERQKARFATIARRYDAAPTEVADAPAFPDYLKQQHAYADIWFVDLLEWEMAGDPLAVAQAIVGDLRYPNGIRRRALVVILTVADAVASGTRDDTETLVTLAGQLGELQSYAALAPIEKLYEHPQAQVRCAAVRALRFLYFKRAFVVVRRALADRDATVRDAALVAIAGLHFPHALGPLSRIYQDVADPRVRAAALDAIGKIQTVEAGEVLVGVLRQESGALRDAARAALLALDNADMVPILRQHYEVEPDPATRDMLGEILRRA